MRRVFELREKSLSPRTKTGSLITDAEGNILGEGWNTNLNHDPDGWAASEWAAHAEVNAIYDMLRKGQAIRKNLIMYNTWEPCLNCLKYSYYAGVRTIYYKIPITQQWEEPGRIAFAMAVGIQLIRVKPPKRKKA